MDVEELRHRLLHEHHALPVPESLLKRGLRLDEKRQRLALAWQESHPQHHILYPTHPCYPPLLDQISDPPTVLFVIGEPSRLLQPSIAIVGSRAVSRSGCETSYQLSKALATEGYLVTSGMAAGIDGAAHQAALDIEGATAAILGTGVDIVYPKRHNSLYNSLLASGCVVSEFWPGTKPYAGNFPKRNRIISGMSLGTVVIEANRKSGSLITARLAMEQGREVFAVPGNILDGYHQGCHDLIKQGAKLVDGVADIIEEITTLSQSHLEELHRRHHIGEEIACDLPFAPLLASVGYETTPLDVVVEHSGKTIELVLEQMLELELQGWVSAVPGGYIRLKRS
ncbi:DNA-processing protein DprA [Shewanella waksmanii]|uniref:DNA-processing protein DprA n=1 Tax=Shewanella waksmanii TaxID=213783 RepID=UPI00048EC65A|nr:DNA-processing protein DprA [Shewanella waksmanii]